MTATEAIKHVPKSRHFINGKFVEGTGAHIEVRNPATGDLLTTVPDAAPADIDKAVAAARASFESKSWRGLDPSRREKILWRLAELMELHKEELSALESAEN